MSDRGSIRGSPKGCVPLGTYRMEKTRGLIDGMGTVGFPGTMVIIGALKTMLHDQCLVTSHGKLQGHIWEYQETP